MKRYIFIIMSILILAASVVTHQLNAHGQSLSEKISSLTDEALSFSNHPLDHRYRLLYNNQDDSTIMAIAENSHMNKRHLLKILTDVAKQFDIEPALLVAIATQESMLDPNARSHMGAMGLMQLMPATARRFGVKNILDPRQNAMGGARYFRYLLNEFNEDVELSLAAYNAGSAPVREYNAIPPFAQTQTFVKRVIKLRDHYRQVL